MIITYEYYRVPNVHSFEGYEYRLETSNWLPGDGPFAVTRDVGSGPELVTLISVANPHFQYVDGSYVYYPDTPVLKPGVEIVTQTQYDEYIVRLHQHFADVVDPD